MNDHITFIFVALVTGVVTMQRSEHRFTNNTVGIPNVPNVVAHVQLKRRIGKAKNYYNVYTLTWIQYFPGTRKYVHLKVTHH